MDSISVVRFLYFIILSASLFITFLPHEIATTISTHIIIIIIIIIGRIFPHVEAGS
jgi:hypothetical protein